jgi:hypothetical protein
MMDTANCKCFVPICCGKWVEAGLDSKMSHLLLHLAADIMATPQQDFLNSCTMGEVFKVEKMLQNKEADVNKPDSKGFTPLHLTIGAKQQFVPLKWFPIGPCYPF